MERLLTARELAERLGVNRRWILVEWQAGRLPGYRLSTRMVRFRESEVEAWLQARAGGERVEPDRQLRAVR